jgi:UDP-glucose 4-epimerase
MSVVCVTGGAGFIGSHIADALVERGDTVIVLDDLSSGIRENVPEGARLEVLDIRSIKARQLLIDEKVEILVHHAAQMDVRRSVENPLFDADVNIIGLLNLLEASHQGSLKKVVFASTGGAIYGEQDVHPADESHPVRPISPYGVAKLASERYLFYYHVQHRLNVTCLRYANVYGPRQNPHGEAGVVAIFADRLLDESPCTINGDGLQTRDYVFVGDVVKANIKAINGDGFKIYNVGTAVETNVVELFSLIRDALGNAPDAKHGKAQPGEQRRSCITAALLKDELNIEVSTHLKDGITQTAHWFRDRRQGAGAK